MYEQSTNQMSNQPLGTWFKYGHFLAQEKLNKLAFLPGIIFLLVPISVTSIELWSYFDGIELYNEGLADYPTFNAVSVTIFWVIGLFPLVFSIMIAVMMSMIYKHIDDIQTPVIFDKSELSIRLFCNYRWIKIPVKDIRKVSTFRERKMKDSPDIHLGKIVVILKNGKFYKPIWTIFMVDKTKEQIESIVDVYGNEIFY